MPFCRTMGLQANSEAIDLGAPVDWAAADASLQIDRNVKEVRCNNKWGRKRAQQLGRNWHLAFDYLNDARVMFFFAPKSAG